MKKEIDKVHEQSERKNPCSCIIFFLVVYVGYQVYRYMYSPIKTEPVQQYTIDETVYAQGIVIRDEIPVEGVTSGVVSYFYDDGVRVITGTPVAKSITVGKMCRISIE